MDALIFDIPNPYGELCTALTIKEIPTRVSGPDWTDTGHALQLPASSQLPAQTLELRQIELDRKKPDRLTINPTMIGK